MSLGGIVEGVVEGVVKGVAEIVDGDPRIKFDKIFNEIWGGESYKNQKGEKIRLRAAAGPFWDSKFICIEKQGEPSYRLVCRKWQFELNYWHQWEWEPVGTVRQLTPTEVINEVLPRFEKRLQEAKKIKERDRKKSLNDAGKYAYQKDQSEAEQLIDNSDWA